MCLLRERVCLLVSVLSTTSNNRLLYDASSPLVTIQANVLSLSKRGQRFHRCAYTRMYWFRFSSMASLLFFSFGVTRVVAVGDVVVCVCFVIFSHERSLRVLFFNNQPSHACPSWESCVYILTGCHSASSSTHTFINHTWSVLPLLHV